MRLSREARLRLPEIEEACRISADDIGIAKFYHVPIYEVQTIRLVQADTPKPRLSLEEEGSAMLLKATERLFRKWERRNGFQEGAAKILLPAGFMLKNAA